mmetsp:Transcript_4829/g.6379  ORF Transcript_4829/g.6379 Transcript_4829/m.6379 type:complete len:86 (-) Transcript_4829:1765-2022(-)
MRLGFDINEIHFSLSLSARLGEGWSLGGDYEFFPLDGFRGLSGSVEEGANEVAYSEAAGDSSADYQLVLVGKNTGADHVKACLAV